MKINTDFNLSSETKAIADILRLVNVGTVIDYARLTRSIGRDVQSAARSALTSARHVVMREERMVFDVVRGIGLKRLNDVEIVDSGDKDRASIHRRARKAARKVTCVEYDSLPKEKQVKHNATLAVLGVMAELSTAKGLARVEGQVVESGSKEVPHVKAAIAALGGIS